MPQAQLHLPPQVAFVPRIVANPEPWIRAGYPNLLRQIQQSHRREPELCWRLAARLDGCLPRTGIPAVPRRPTEPNRAGLIRVLLAKATFRIATQRREGPTGADDGDDPFGEIEDLAPDTE